MLSGILKKPLFKKRRMIERERTFLVKTLPSLEGCPKKEIFDLYIPASVVHPNLRIRKEGERAVITKKQTLDSASIHQETTIPLTSDEAKVVFSLEGKVLKKIRYFLQWEGRIAHLDVFLGELKGLVLVDVEFESEKEMSAFAMPDFCLADVTKEVALAGGMLAGKSYDDIRPVVEKYGYVMIDSLKIS